MILINNWTIGYGDHSPYTAPELLTIHLKGEAFNHPKLGTAYVTTSAIIDVKKRIVYTSSGSVYKLGWISPLYRKWLKKHYPKWDWRNPITIIESDEEV